MGVAALVLGRVLQTEHTGILVIGERFCITGPADDRPKCLLSKFLRHVVLQFLPKATGLGDTRRETFEAFVLI